MISLYIFVFSHKKNQLKNGYISMFASLWRYPSPSRASLPSHNQSILRSPQARPPPRYCILNMILYCICGCDLSIVFVLALWSRPPLRECIKPHWSKWIQCRLIFFHCNLLIVMYSLFGFFCLVFGGNGKCNYQYHICIWGFVFGILGKWEM